MTRQLIATLYLVFFADYDGHVNVVGRWRVLFILVSGENVQSDDMSLQAKYPEPPTFNTWRGDKNHTNLSLSSYHKTNLSRAKPGRPLIQYVFANRNDTHICMFFKSLVVMIIWHSAASPYLSVAVFSSFRCGHFDNLARMILEHDEATFTQRRALCGNDLSGATASLSLELFVMVISHLHCCNTKRQSTLTSSTLIDTVAT